MPFYGKLRLEDYEIFQELKNIDGTEWLVDFLKQWEKRLSPSYQKSLPNTFDLNYSLEQDAKNIRQLIDAALKHYKDKKTEYAKMPVAESPNDPRPQTVAHNCLKSEEEKENHCLNMDILRKQANIMKAQARKIDAEANLLEIEGASKKEYLNSPSDLPF